MEPKRRTYKIISWNIRSIFKRLNDITMYVLNNNIDILCLQETHCKTNKSKSLPNITGYNSYFHDTASGLAVYIKKSIVHQYIKVSTNNDNEF